MENNVFEQMAKRYDTAERMKLAEIIVNKMKPKLQNCKDKTLLDYGSGTGLIGLELSDSVKAVLLVDSSSQMLEMAKAKIAQRKIQNAQVLEADFTQEVPSVKADIVFMSLVLLHIPDTNKILQNLFSVLNDGGELWIVDFDKNERISHPKVHNGFAHEELKGQLAEAGFGSTEIQTFHHGKELFMKQDASLFLARSVKR